MGFSQGQGSGKKGPTTDQAAAIPWSFSSRCSAGPLELVSRTKSVLIALCSSHAWLTWHGLNQNVMSLLPPPFICLVAVVCLRVVWGRLALPCVVLWRGLAIMSRITYKCCDWVDERRRQAMRLGTGTAQQFPSTLRVRARPWSPCGSPSLLACMNAHAQLRLQCLRRSKSLPLLFSSFWFAFHAEKQHCPYYTYLPSRHHSRC